MKLIDPTDAELDAAFATEVAGWTFYDGQPKCQHGSGEVPWDTGQRTCGKRWNPPASIHSDRRWHRTKEDATKAVGFVFTTSADAVLPYLEKAEVVCHRVPAQPLWHFRGYGPQWEGVFVEDKCFARGGVLALLRAHGCEVEFTK